MKKIFFVMAIMTVFTTVARDRLYIENFSIAQGETLTIPVQLDNDTAYCAFQTDLYLPQGMQVEVTLDDEYETYNIYLTSRKTPYHRISTALLPDGAIRIAVTAYPVFPFSGNSGPIATIELTATEELSNAVLTLHNSITVEESGQMHYLDDCEAIVNAATALQGDVNGDGDVNVMDITALIDIIMNDGTNPRADVNQDGDIDVRDITALIDIIMNS